MERFRSARTIWSTRCTWICRIYR